MTSEFWNTKRCTCTLCEDGPFTSIIEGKTHVHAKHRIPFLKTRQYLKTKL